MERLSRLFSILLILLSGALAGCVNPPEQPSRPKTYRAQSGNLAEAMRGARTFSFHPRARVVRPVDGRAPAILQNRIERAITSVFADHGIAQREPSEGRGDRVLAYAIGVSGELGDAELAEIFGISAGLDLESQRATADSERSASRGGIVLAILDPTIGAVVWRTSGSATRDRPESKRRSEAEQIEHAIRLLLAGLSPSR